MASDCWAFFISDWIWLSQLNQSKWTPLRRSEYIVIFYFIICPFHLNQFDTVGSPNPTQIYRPVPQYNPKNPAILYSKIWSKYDWYLLQSWETHILCSINIHHSVWSHFYPTKIGLMSSHTAEMRSSLDHIQHKMRCISSSPDTAHVQWEMAWFSRESQRTYDHNILCRCYSSSIYIIWIAVIKL